MRKPFQYGTFTNMSSKEHAVQYLQKGRTLRLPMHSENARKKSTTQTTANNTRPVRNAPIKKSQTCETRKQSRGLNRGKCRRRSGPLHQRTPRRLGEHKINPPNGV